ncbi:MAG: hypothetical protein QOI47_1107 [Actinomycetota bacterium]|nr:hypothetical protein [Actinomycetota bacterium]
MTLRRACGAALVVIALSASGCGGAQGLSKKDVIDGLVTRHFTPAQATCIADRIFTSYTGARRDKLAKDLDGSLSSDDRAALTAIVDACTTS